MKFKLLLLAALISNVIACTDDDKKTTSPKPSQTKSSKTVNNQKAENSNNTVSKSSALSDATGLIEPAAQGDITLLGGARRLQAERTEALKASLSNRNVKNVILIIGDGTSDSEITIARNYAEGASGYFKGLDRLPITGAYTTYALQKGNNQIDYVTDSAASATAWATGVKTYNNALGIDTFGNPQKSILKLAKENGYATGNVTTTEIQDATPAAQVANISYRWCPAPSATSKLCNPYALEQKGAGSITEQLLMTRADVTLGGGAKYFSEVATAGSYQNQSLLSQAKALNYQLPTDLDSLNKIQTANQDRPVLGLFAPGDLPVSLSGPLASINGNEQSAVSCQPNAQHSAQIPSLKAMTAKAIELLSQNPKGFFLQVESGSIDKRNHFADACGQIGETIALDEAVQVALDFAKKNPDTLIIVTGDHAHTSQIIPNDAKSPGKTVALKTKDNQKMTINYATTRELSDPRVNYQQHTGAQVRVAAYGPHAANVSGLIDQSDVFFIMKNAFGFK